MKILLASNNKHKYQEFSNILKGYEIITPRDLNDDFEVDETGTTLEENSFLKASYYHQKYDYDVISDDTGLFCDGIDGMPGVYSARYASLGTSKTFHDDALNRQKLINELEGKDKKAYFKTIICLYCKNGDVYYFDGIVNGEILDTNKGLNGFGYDSLFYSYELGKTFGEATEEEKNNVSHRARAAFKLKSFLENK